MINNFKIDYGFYDNDQFCLKGPKSNNLANCLINTMREYHFLFEKAQKELEWKQKFVRAISATKLNPKELNQRENLKWNSPIIDVELKYLF